MISHALYTRMRLHPCVQRRVRFDPEEITNQYSLDYDAYINWKVINGLLPQVRYMEVL